MKTKNFRGKLALNKLTIASLEVQKLGNVRGGLVTVDAASVDEPCVKTEPPVCDTDEFTCGIFCTFRTCL